SIYPLVPYTTLFRSQRVYVDIEAIVLQALPDLEAHGIAELLLLRVQCRTRGASDHRVTHDQTGQYPCCYQSHGAILLRTIVGAMVSIRRTGRQRMPGTCWQAAEAEKERRRTAERPWFPGAPQPRLRRALRNMRNHGASSPQCGGHQECWIERKLRSGCGIMMV